MIQLIEWNGKQYEVKYSFKFIQRLKAVGISIPRIYGSIVADPQGAGFYLDDYAIVTCECLREAGAPVDIGQVWDAAKADPAIAAACAKLFMWLVTQHYAVSPNAPK